MTLVVADLITTCRVLSNDTPLSNYITAETPLGAVNGTYTHFRLQNRNIVTGSVYVSYGSTYRSQTGFTVDTANGIITFSVAPTVGTVLLFDYNYYVFSDADWTQFLDAAAGMITAGSDPTAVDPNQRMALEQFALYHYFMRRAAQYAEKYSSSGGLASEQIDSVTKNFVNLANTALRNGTKFRDDIYIGQGAEKKASSAVVRFAFDPMTPPR